MTERRHEGWEVIASQISRERRARSLSLKRAVLISRRTAFFCSRGVLGGRDAAAEIEATAGWRGRGVARTGTGTGGIGFGFGFGFLAPTLALGVASFTGRWASGFAGASVLAGFVTFAALTGLGVPAGGLSLAELFFAAGATALAGTFFFGGFAAKGFAGGAVFLVDGEFRGGITTNLSAASRVLASLPVPGGCFRG
jgi:hypothetical protein